MRIISVEYNIALVTVSILIAMVASFTALSHISRLRSSLVPNHQVWWLLLASICMGGGIWSMHFVAMLSSNTQYQIRFDAVWTFVSFILPIAGTMLAFGVMYRFNRPRTAILAGTLMGLTIVSMHYMGMASVKRTVTMLHHDPNYVLMAMIIAISASIISLYVFFRNVAENFKMKLLSAFLLGLAITGMHYTGVLGQTIYRIPGTEGITVSTDGSLDKTQLALAIACLSFVSLFTSILAGVSASSYQRKLNNEQLQVLINELNHRVKNTLATVQSLAKHSLRGCEQDKLDTFESRLISLAKVHTLLTESNWEAITFRSMLCSEISVYTTDDGPTLTLQGDAKLELLPEIALPLEMVIHELTTNAVKYGALSVPTGNLFIGWEVEGTMLNIFWKETGGPPPEEPTAIKGFGSTLIGQTVRQLGGTIEKQFHPWGLECELIVNLTGRKKVIVGDLTK